MRKLGLGLVAVAVLVVAALVVLSIVGLDPLERRPGLWLRGRMVNPPITDWAFTDKYPTIAVETRAWYGLPHAVTTTITAHNNQLYLTSVYRPGMKFPDDRLWNRNIMRDPRVRLKIGDQVFDGTVALVTDPAEKDAVLETKAKKYPRQRVADKNLVYVFRVQPG
jgi:hypothetical protein